jgi:hypothetical protein
MRAVVWVVVCGGCSLYFDSPKQAPEPDAAVPDATATDAGMAVTCPVPGTTVTIGFPINGATSVAQPVPIQTTIDRPLDVDEVFVAWLTDANNVPVQLDPFYDAACSTVIPNRPVDPVAWTECLTNLGSGVTYIWHVNVECYGASTDTILDLAATTFTTAR